MTQEREGNLGEVIDRRVQVYGDPLVTYPRIAQMWSGLLGIEVSATDVCLCIIALKSVRAHEMPDYSDNSDDIEGYLDIFRKLVGDDMIHARSVADFIAQKWPADDHPSLFERSDILPCNTPLDHVGTQPA